MTTANSPFAQGRNPRFDLLATRLAHRTWALFVLAAAAPFFARLIDQVLGYWPTILLLCVIMSTLIVLAVTVMAWHVYALCPVCAQKTPLDPTVVVARKRRPLRTFHWLGEKHHKALNRTLLALLILSFVPYASFGAYPLLMLSMAIIVHLGNVHMPLQPWCPQCDWDDGGGKERVPQPDPTGEAVR